MKFLRLIASLKLTVLAMIALGAGVALADPALGRGTWPIAIPLAVLALNLAAAIVALPRLRRTPALLIFHCALLAVLLLAALGRMTYLKARVEVTEGAAFDGRPVELNMGPWHDNRLSELQWFNEKFVIDYTPIVTIAETRNSLRYIDADGVERQAMIGENTPLMLQGYRFYTTSGKGFAAVFRWIPEGENGSQVSSAGSVHFPRYPSDPEAQMTEFSLPGGVDLWLKLQFKEAPLVEGQVSQLRPPKDHWLVVRTVGPGEERRLELRPGETMRLPGGTLVYEELRLWMGYLVYYDRTVPWILAASVLAVLAMAAHFWMKYARSPW